MKATAARRMKKAEQISKDYELRRKMRDVYAWFVVWLSTLTATRGGAVRAAKRR